MNVDVPKLDRQIKFLQEQAARLDAMRAQPGNQWATRNADMMRSIAEVLAELRREHQMTSLGGKRLE